MALSRKNCLLAAGAAVAVFLAALAATEWLNGDAPATGLLRPEDADLIAAGRTVYKAHCASCHGLDLSGEALSPSGCYTQRGRISSVCLNGSRRMANQQTAGVALRR